MAKVKEEFKVLEWLRAVRDKAYEEWRRDPLNFYKKRAKRAKEFEREVAELAKKQEQMARKKRAKTSVKSKTKRA